MRTGQKVLVVEDEFLIAELLSDMVSDLGLIVCGIADTADGAVRTAATTHPDLVLMDVRLKGAKDGVDAALEIRSASGCPVVFITGSREPANVARIDGAHPAATLFKPIFQHQLQRTLEGVLN